MATKQEIKDKLENEIYRGRMYDVPGSVQLEGLYEVIDGLDGSGDGGAPLMDLKK